MCTLRKKLVLDINAKLIFPANGSVLWHFMEESISDYIV